MRPLANCHLFCASFPHVKNGSDTYFSVWRLNEWMGVYNKCYAIANYLVSLSSSWVSYTGFISRCVFKRSDIKEILCLFLWKMSGCINILKMLWTLVYLRLWLYIREYWNEAQTQFVKVQRISKETLRFILFLCFLCSGDFNFSSWCKLPE